jgi:hypothetical protein
MRLLRTGSHIIEMGKSEEDLGMGRFKKREKGEVYRPLVTVLKMKGKRPSVIMVSGERYILDKTYHANREMNN